jgi:G3E family GTPase
VRCFVCSAISVLKPDSAFPATLAFQIRELEKETSGGLKLDAIVTVVDAENFVGYEDTSPTAKMQSAYTDLILIVGRDGFPLASAYLKS